MIENQFTLIGCTAIEDKLQEEVAETISFIKKAGIKLWVLTGDKIETAINIGFSCALLDRETEIFIISETSTNKIWHQLIDAVSKQKQVGFSRDCAIVIGGEALAKITREGNEKMMDEFIEMTDKVKVVLACRVSPIQKAQIVTMMREKHEKAGITSLAIGDGANDVNMITAAHVGVGISGLEGQQAARASDYSIG
jgi:phospholipid-transporting ATPase